MSIKWTGSVSDSGILRKSDFKEKKEELFVFGYSCKLFRDDEKALHIDQGKHLIPWMGDETLKIDRYDARGALHDVSSLEAPPGGFDWRVELTRSELDVEQLCDEERFRALHTDEDEEEMYKEEELKRLHAAGYGQVGFNYDTPAEAPAPTTPLEVDEPFAPTPSYRALFASDVLLPDSQKQNTIIEKTANFIASQGAQMEILIKAKQGDNPQFRFLDMGAPLRPYYLALVALVKAGKWPEKVPEVVEEKPPENEEYLHPSLAATVIELAPSIPSIHYRPSADCDYTMLVSKMRGEAAPDDYTPELAPGEVPPPGTEPLPPRARAMISRAPVMYTSHHHASPPPAPALAPAPAPAPPPRAAPAKSTGLSLMKNYNTDSDSDASDYDSSSSDSKDKPLVITPPEEVQAVVDKMAAYVARNGDEFAEIVRAKNDPRFTFLEPENIYHAYYKKLMQQKRGGEPNGKDEPKRTSAPVSFSIKKLKEPDPILPKPALPYESSSEDETEKTDRPESPKPSPQIPQAVVYKMEAQTAKPEPVKAVNDRKEDRVVQPVLVQPERIIPKPEIPEIRKEKSLTPEKKTEKPKDIPLVKRDKRKHSKASKSENRERKRDQSAKKEKIRDKESGKKCEIDEIISLEDNDDELIDLTGDYSDSKMEVESEAERAKQRQRRARAAEFLRRVGVDPAAAMPASSLASAMVDTLESLRKKKAVEEEKRRRREKKRHRSKYENEDDEKAHRKKRRKYRSSEENDESDIDGSKKKRRKKEKKNKNKKKKKRETEVEEIHELPPNIDLSNTLKVLRTTSPTKEICQGLEEIEPQRQPSSDDEERHRRKKNESRSPSEGRDHRRKRRVIESRQESSSDEERDYKRKDESEKEMEHRRKKKKKEDREYSEGEWSSDSEEDSGSSVSRDD